MNGLFIIHRHSADHPNLTSWMIGEMCAAIHGKPRLSVFGPCASYAEALEKQRDFADSGEISGLFARIDKPIGDFLSSVWYRINGKWEFLFGDRIGADGVPETVLTEAVLSR